MNPVFPCAHACATEWRQAVDACLDELATPAMSASNSKLGFLYVTDHFAGEIDAILTRFKQETGVGQWVGTVGVGVCASGIEYFDEPAMSVMLGDFPEGSAQVFSGRQRPPAGGAHFAVVHGDPRTADMGDLVADMAAKLESGYLVGGISSSRDRTFQIANDVIEGGLSGAVFGADVGVVSRMSQGCVPLPARHTITECDRNIIFALDNRPALDVLKEDIGELLSRNLARAGHTIFAGLPISGSETNDYRVRNLVGVDPGSKVVAIGDTVENGQALMFCKRDADSARRDLERMLDDIKRDLTRPARGALYFSCLGRGENMFGAKSAELKAIRDALGEVPLAGFFANGEISHGQLYAYTGVLTLFI